MLKANFPVPTKVAFVLAAGSRSSLPRLTGPADRANRARAVRAPSSVHNAKRTRRKKIIQKSRIKKNHKQTRASIEQKILYLLKRSCGRTAGIYGWLAVGLKFANEFFFLWIYRAGARPFAKRRIHSTSYSRSENNCVFVIYKIHSVYNLLWYGTMRKIEHLQNANFPIRTVTFNSSPIRTIVADLENRYYDAIRLFFFFINTPIFLRNKYRGVHPPFKYLPVALL